MAITQADHLPAAFDATAQELMRMMGRCPACRGEFGEHSFALFACTRICRENKDRLLGLERMFHAHAWDCAKEFQDFDPTWMLWRYLSTGVPMDKSVLS